MAIDKSVISMLREFQEEGKPDFVQELFELFVSLTPPMLIKMEKGLDAKDYLTIARTAHTLKSQAGNLGAKRMGILCGEIENLARGDKPSHDLLVPLVENARKEYEDVEKELRVMFPSV
jgi:two-component system sensor histidine kinase/response regulator